MLRFLLRPLFLATSLFLPTALMAQIPTGRLTTTVTDGRYRVTVMPNPSAPSVPTVNRPPLVPDVRQSYTDQAAAILAGLQIPKPPSTPISVPPDSRVNKTPDQRRLAPSASDAQPSVAAMKARVARERLFSAVEACTILVLDTGKFGCLGGLRVGDPSQCSALEQDLRDCYDAIAPTIRTFSDFFAEIGKAKRPPQHGPAFTLPRGSGTPRDRIQ